MSWVCKICSSNNDDSSKCCTVCDAPKNDKKSRSACKLTKKRAEALGLSGDIVIPDKFNVIGESAFEGRKDIYSVVLPDSVAVIEKRAFAKCINLEKVEAKKLNSIKHEAFFDCVKLSKSDRPTARYVSYSAFGSKFFTRLFVRLFGRKRPNKTRKDKAKK